MMRRIITGIGLLLGLVGPGLGSEAPSPEPPVYQYLIVVEASAAMLRQKEMAMDTIHALLLSGLQGRIQRGEVLGIWPFKDQLDYKLVRPIHWSAPEARDLSNFIYRKLRDLEFSNEPEISLPLAAVTAEASRSERLTVFLVTSGSELIRGTPFDAEINAVFEQHGAAMAKAKRPFVTVLVFEGGELVAQAVTPGGRTIYIPPTPASTAALAVASVPEAAKPEPTLPTPEPAKPEHTLPTPEPAPKPRPMSVEEISAKLREAEAQQRSLETNQVSAETAAVTEPGADEPAPGVEAPVEPAEPPRSPSGTETEDESSKTSLRPADRPSVEVALPEPVVQQPEPATADASGSAANSASAETAVEESEVPVAPGLMLPSEGRAERNLYLGVGVGLFVLAMGILWWRMRRPRGRGRASVISQSMHRR